ncbi:MAG: DUF3320 domain-containing protein, partial [Longimicrobiales bacterium]
MRRPLVPIVEAIEHVIDTESPIHEAEVMARIASFWGTK